MVKVKICGITNMEDALAAAEYGADMLGFIFVPSPRKVSKEIAKEIIAKLPASTLKVGVFMDQEIGEVKKTVSFCGLDLVQLHGNESPEFCANLDCSVIKSFTPQSLPELNKLRDYKADLVMLDKQKGKNTPPEELWPIAREMAQCSQVILAGALTPENVAEAIRIAQPYAVDVASGVEKEPGKKDHQKIKNFIHAAKS